MKTKQHFIILLFLLSVALNFGQAQFTEAGIAVQGIVRDANNTAIQSKTVNLSFEFYYRIDGATQPNFVTDSKNVNTDGFGVFSTTIDPSSAFNHYFSNYQVWLRIRIANNETPISDSPLQHVPYAISANNGVPTGSIMPFLGTEVPAGWILCNGQSWANVGPKGDRLKAVLGNPGAVPNLQGRFLKGVGAPVEANVEGIGLSATQNQSTITKAHNHTVGTLAVNNGAAQTQSNRTVPLATGNWSTQNYAVVQRFEPNPVNVPYISGTNIDATSSTLVHNHGISGNTGQLTTPDNSEVRPSSYGVNYIIKL